MSNVPRTKVLLFYNPNSGNGLFKNNLDIIIGRFQDKGYQVVPVRAAGGLYISDVLSEINEDEYRQILVAGGDGTINICVNAMVKNGIELPVAILPAGTANDFAYYFEIPNDIDAMLDIALGDHLATADVGVCNGRYFINVAALGNLVDVSQKTDPNLKNTLGVFSYYLKGFSEVVTLKPLPIKLTTPDKVYDEEMLFMIVMNGVSAGGLKKLSPNSEINDGLLDVMVFEDMPVIRLAPLLVNALQGLHPKDKKVLYFQTDKLKIESPVDISTDVDGEHGEKLPLDFSVLHDRLKVFTSENF